MPVIGRVVKRMNRELLIITARENMQRLMLAQSLSASIGVMPDNLVETITQLALWIRNPAATFENWHYLMNTAGALWLAWYDEYSAILTRPMEDLGGLWLLEWYESTGLNGGGIC